MRFVLLSRYTNTFLAFLENSLEFRLATLLKVSVVLSCLLTASAGHTSEQPIYYAGVSYLGDESLVGSNYPVALALNTSQNVENRLDSRWYQQLASTQLPFVLLNDALGNYEEGPAIAMSLAIEREATSVETFSDYRKLIAEVNAQILFFDFQSKRLVASIPVAIARNAAIELTADIHEEKRINLAALYLEATQDKTLLTLATQQLNQFVMPKEAALRVKVDKVVFSPKALNYLPKELDEKALIQIIGQYFTAQLAYHSKLNMIPYTHGYAIRNKMSVRMSNDDVYQLTLPEPDYVLALDISNFKALVKQEKSLYASRILVSAHEATDSQFIFNDYFHFAVAKLVSNNKHLTDDWAAYEDSLETLLTELSQQLASPSKKWFDAHSQKKRTNYKAFKHWSKELNVF